MTNCLLCEKEFGTKSELLKHYSNEHPQGWQKVGSQIPLDSLEDNRNEPNRNTWNEDKVVEYLENEGFFVQKIEPAGAGGYSGISGLDNFIKQEVIHRSKKVEKKQNIEKFFCKGTPDLLVKGDCPLFFVEVKSYMSALRQSQIKWIEENPEFDVLFASGKQNPEVYRYQKLESISKFM